MKPLAPFLVALFVSLPAHSAAAQQTCQPSWLPTFAAQPGTNSDIYALTVFDDLSAGGPALYAGGSFTSAGSVLANRIANWDGARWSALGSGMDNDVNALTVFDDGNGGGPALYAGGRFTNAGTVAANRIAKWDGSSWSALGSGLDGGVHALTVFDDGSGGGPALYAGGNFTSAGGVSVNRIAKWDGASWSALGVGMNGGVYSVTVFDDGTGSGPALYAGGTFTSTGGVATNNIAKWDGSVWSALGSGVGFFFGSGVPSVDALTVFDDGSGGGPALYAAGDFTSAGGVPAKRIAKWDGSNWSILSSGLQDRVRALTVFDDGSGGGPALYAGGDFRSTSAGTVLAKRIAKWSGSSWSVLGSGFDRGVRALTAFDAGNGSGPALYAGGTFAVAGGVPAICIANWDGSSWSALGSGLDGGVHALTVFDDGSGGGPALYAGGKFTGAGGVSVDRIAKWDEPSWSALGNGVGGNIGEISALTVFDDGSGGGPALYAGGSFDMAGGTSANNIAKWDGLSWSALGSGVVGAPFTYGIFGFVFALTVFDDGSGGRPALYAGGVFISPASDIAKWDGTNWSPLGSAYCGMSFFTERVLALTVFDDGTGGGPALYAGGGFASVCGVPANSIAKWDGSIWSALGSGVIGTVNALTVFDDGRGGGPALYAGGGFASAGGVPAHHIAKWDGSSWSALGSGMDNEVNSLTVFDDESGGGPALYAGGSFTAASGVLADHIAKWDGSLWSGLGSAMNADVSALTVFDDGSGGGPALYAGGHFTVSASGDSYLAKYGCPPSPFTTFCTAKTQLVCGPANITANGTPSATATSGFTIKAQPVRGCRAGLLLYSNQPTVTGAPFGGPGDGVLCLFAMGLKRAGPIMTGSLPNLCESTLAIDMNRFNTNNWTAGGCNPPPGQNNPAGFLGNPGTTVNAQMWGRDSIATGQVLSDGISWTVGP